jgi:predicted anti-sigma-YlaC factor YlaD
MNCSAYHALLRDFMSNDVSASQRVELEQHAAECSDCAGLHAIAREMTCRELTDFLDDYLELRLPGERQAKFERHLSICNDCKTYLGLYRRAVELAKRAYAGDRDEGSVHQDLVRRILDARGER